MNGSPIKAADEMTNVDEFIGDKYRCDPNKRRSWLCLDEEIRHPAVINSKALNIAWVHIWKNANCGIDIPIVVNIIPSWLRVDKAIIFFISFS